MADVLHSGRPSIIRHLYEKIKKFKDKIFGLLSLYRTRREPLQNDIKSIHNQHLVSRSSFMDLPVELRQLIYAYLIPHTAVTSGTRYNPCVPLKHDDKPRRLALLETNRKIYHEMVELLYQSTLHYVSLRKSNLRFVNRDFLSIASLPFGFQFIRNLSLSVVAGRSLEYISHGERYGSVSEALQHLALVKGIADFFSESGPGSLQNLNLTLDFEPTFFIFILGPMEPSTALDRRATIRNILEFNFRSLRNIRVSRCITIEEFDPQYSMIGCLGEIREDIIAVKREYFDILKKEISGDYQKA